MARLGRVRRRRPALRSPTVPDHLAAALDRARHNTGWLNNPATGPCRCDGCTGHGCPIGTYDGAHQGRLARLTTGEHR
jgi:hypothetical protein